MQNSNRGGANAPPPLFLTKETKVNEGEVPQYYVENNHEAIISPQVFDWVQEEIKRRCEGRGRYSGVSIFSSKIKCGQCGGWYGAKVWHSTDKVQQLIAENARVAQNQDDYDRNYNELVSRYEAVKTQYDKTCEAIQYRKARSRQMDNFIQEVREQELIKEFDARLWGSLVDFITVYSKDDIRVTFKDGTEIRA